MFCQFRPFVFALALIPGLLAVQLLPAQEVLFTNDASSSQVIELRTTEAPPTPPQLRHLESSRTQRAPVSASSLPDPLKISFDEISGDQPAAPVNTQPVQSPPAARQAMAFQPDGTQTQVDGITLGSGTTGTSSVTGTQPTYLQVAQPWTEPATGNTGSIANSSPVPTVETRSIAPQITTRLVAPKSINVNEPATIVIEVSNTSRAAAKDVILTTTIPSHTTVNSSSPRPTTVNERTLEFRIPSIQSGQNQQINLSLIPTTKQAIAVSTSVRIENIHTVNVAVQQPELRIDVAGPGQANLGNWSQHVVTITNSGDGIARNIGLTHQLPETMQQGLETSELKIPALAPGASRKIQFKSMSTAAGDFDMKFVASGNHCEARTAVHTVKVFQPELQVSASSPELTFVNRDGIYSVQVENRGEVEITGVVVALATPPGIKVTTVSREASVNPQSGQLTWEFASIPAQATETIQLKATALAPGNQICVLQVGSNETVAEKFELVTQVQTHADVSINLINQNGPIEVGAKTEFVVKVENRGSRIANGVDVSIELAPSLMPVASDGYQVNEMDNTIRFESLDIPAGESRELKFAVASVARGEHVVRGVVRISDSNRRLIAEDSVFVFDPDQAKVSESLTPSINKR